MEASREGDSPKVGSRKKELQYKARRQVEIRLAFFCHSFFGVEVRSTTHILLRRRNKISCLSPLSCGMNKGSIWIYAGHATKGRKTKGDFPFPPNLLCQSEFLLHFIAFVSLAFYSTLTPSGTSPWASSGRGRSISRSSQPPRRCSRRPENDRTWEFPQHAF